MGGGGHRSSRRRNYLPYQLVRQFQRDVILGLGMLAVSGFFLLVINAAVSPVKVDLIVEGPQYQAKLDNGTVCQIYETQVLDEQSGDVRAMIDCGDVSGPGVAGVFEYIFWAIFGVGAVMALSGAIALGLSTFVSREMLVIPVGVVGVIAGIIAISWGIGGEAPAIVFQGARDHAVTGLLRVGGAVTSRDSAIAWGVGVISASALRVTRA